jgi:hypothetical protein
MIEDYTTISASGLRNLMGLAFVTIKSRLGAIRLIVPPMGIGLETLRFSNLGAV